MVDEKITDYTAQTGAGLATADLFETVDVSDTTMDATGTNKKLTADELAKALATSTFGYATGNEPGARGTSGSLASTYDRAPFAEANALTPSSGRLVLVRILLPKGLSVTNISFCSGTTALATGTNQWFALFDSSRNKLAVTADDTSTAWAASTLKTLAVTGGPFVTTYAGWHYLGVMVKATTVPNLTGPTGLAVASIRGLAPIPAGQADTGLTTPATCPATAAALTASGGLPYAEVS